MYFVYYNIDVMNARNIPKIKILSLLSLLTLLEAATGGDL